MSIARRVKQLEEVQAGPGRVVVQWVNHWSGANPVLVDGQAVAEYHPEPGDQVITVRYVKDWKGADDKMG